MKLEKWIEIKKKDHPVSGLEHDDVEKCLNIIKHLMKAVKWYEDDENWLAEHAIEINGGELATYAEIYGPKMARIAIEACEKEIG